MDVDTSSGSPTEPAGSTREDTAESCDDAEIALSILDFVKNLEVTRPEALRGVPAHLALRSFGQGMRDLQNQKLYALSRPERRLDEFWSHSRQASVTWKTGLLLMVKNGRAACIVGSIAAVAAATLSAMDLLPGVYKMPTFWSSQDGLPPLASKDAPLLLWRLLTSRYDYKSGVV